MERKDLLTENAKIFTVQGAAIGQYADPDCKVLVVGNPATPTPTSPRNRQKFGRVSERTSPACCASTQPRPVAACRQDRPRGIEPQKSLVVWGNHSPPCTPDYRFCTSSGDSVKNLVNDEAWNRDVFLPTVGKRGAAIIEARGLSSAASAANAAIDHIRDWVLGSNGEWVTMGIPSDGSYGIPEGIIYGFPVTTENGQYKIVQGLEIDDFSRERMTHTLNELLEEREGVKDLLA